MPMPTRSILSFLLIRVSGHDFSRAVEAQRKSGLLAPGFFAWPGKSRQGLKSLRENSDYPALKGAA